MAYYSNFYSEVPELFFQAVCWWGPTDEVVFLSGLLTDTSDVVGDRAVDGDIDEADDWCVDGTVHDSCVDGVVDVDGLCVEGVVDVDGLCVAIDGVVDVDDLCVGGVVDVDDSCLASVADDSCVSSHVNDPSSVGSGTLLWEFFKNTHRL